MDHMQSEKKKDIEDKSVVETIIFTSRRLKSELDARLRPIDWDILLYLFVEREEEERLQKSVLVGAGVADSSGRRAVQRLASLGLVTFSRPTRRNDRRAKCLSLTADGSNLVKVYCTRVKAGWAAHF